MTNHGRLAAWLVPPPTGGTLDAVLAAGGGRPPRRQVDFRSLPRVSTDESTSDVLDDLRGESGA